MTIERVDNNRGYEPGNVVWADKITQGNNTRRNRFIVVHGEQMTVSQASRRFNTPDDRIRYRLNSGWPDELAVLKPTRRQP